MDQLGSHGRAAVPQDLETGEVVLRDPRELRQQVDHRGDQHGVADALARDRVAEGLRAELRNGDLAGAEPRGREHHRKVRDVEHRRRVQPDAALPILHPGAEVLHGGEDGGVGQHHTLGATGRPAGIDERQDRVRVIDRLGRLVAPDLELLLIEHHLPGHLSTGLRQRRVSDQASRIGVSEHAIDLTG